MPGNVAVEQPGAGVVSLEGNNKVAPSRDQCNISSWGVIKLECHLVLLNEFGVVALSEESKVVAVEM
jgi:hypothetical protein